MDLECGLGERIRRMSEEDTMALVVEEGKIVEHRVRMDRTFVLEE